MTERFYIEGDTFPRRFKLKEAGCLFDKKLRRWYTETPEAKEKALAVMAAPPPPDEGFKPYKCKVCGIKASRYVKIRRDSLCWDCANPDD